MVRKRAWEVGAVLLLVLVSALAYGGFSAYDQQRRRAEGRLSAAMSANDGPMIHAAFAATPGVGVRDRVQRTPLIWAAVFGDLPLLKEALARGGDVNARARGDMTALMWAAAGGHREAVEVLLAAGANVNDRDERGRTALSWAADRLRMVKSERQRAVMALLRSRGATR
jgi:ankyrin repeat protein